MAHPCPWKLSPPIHTFIGMNMRICLSSLTLGLTTVANDVCSMQLFFLSSLTDIMKFQLVFIFKDFLPYHE